MYVYNVMQNFVHGYVQHCSYLCVNLYIAVYQIVHFYLPTWKIAVNEIVNNVVHVRICT